MLLRGVIPIVYTPFAEDASIDDKDLRRLVHHLLNAGAHGLAATGGASESLSMTTAERCHVVELVVQEAAGQVPVIVGVSAPTTEEACYLAGAAERLGAVAVFSNPPPGRNTDLAALHHHYAALANATALPIILQDALEVVDPNHTLELAHHLPSLRYVKEEAVDSGHRISTLVEKSAGRLTILSGGSYLLDDLARGAVGAIPGSVGVADLASAYNAYVAGDVATARTAFNHFLPLSFWRRQFPILGAKEVLRRLGIFKVARMRQTSPLLDIHDHAELTAILESMGPPF